MIERRTPLKRSRLKPRATPVRKRRPGGPRRGPPGIPPEEWRNPRYLRFLRAEGLCKACEVASKGKWRWYPTVPCHGPVNGKSSKGPDSGAIPMCDIHHAEQHAIGWPAFERKYGFSRAAVAAQWWAQFLEAGS